MLNRDKYISGIDPYKGSTESKGSLSNHDILKKQELHEVAIPLNSLILTTNCSKERCDELYKEWLEEFNIE